MNKTSVFQSDMDIAQEFAAGSYEKIQSYAQKAQGELIHHWQSKDGEALEQMILRSRYMLDFWADSIADDSAWTALVRCGAWIGALETIESSLYEENMDAWLRRRIHKNISSIKHLTEIIQLLEVKGVATHGELVKDLHLNYSSTLTEVIKKTADFELIDVRRAGRHKLYSLTDAGVRYARYLKQEKVELKGNK